MHIHIYYHHLFRYVSYSIIVSLYQYTVDIYTNTKISIYLFVVSVSVICEYLLTSLFICLSMLQGYQQFLSFYRRL